MSTIILRNAIQTPDGTVIESFHSHDYVSHTDANGGHYAVDGGRDYLRRSGNMDYKNLSVAVEEDEPYNHQVVREAMSWGATRKKMSGSYTDYIRLKDLESDHIQAILDTQDHIHPFYKKAMEAELEWRKEDSA